MSSMRTPRGIDLEIVETVRTPRTTPVGTDILFPDRVRINGMDVYGLRGSEVTVEVHPLDGTVLATMTLLCRTVNVGAELVLADPHEGAPIFAELRNDQPTVWFWPEPELLTWAACVVATAAAHDRNPGEYGRRVNDSDWSGS